MKIAMITDIHIDISNSHPIHRNNIDKFFDFFWGEMKKRNISHIFCLGDIVDNRQRISFAGVEQIKRCIIDPVEKHDVQFYGIVGNHDCSSRSTNEISSAFLFDNKKNITVFNDVPEEVVLPDGTVIGMLPWINKENYESTCKFLQETEASVIMGHLEIQGALMMKGTVNDHGQDASLFERFSHVFSGHFHHKNSYKNVHYIGNICQFNWGDYGEERGFTIFDTETGEFELVENSFSPFLKIYYNDSEKNYEDLSFMNGLDYSHRMVKLIVVEKNNPYLLDRFAQKISELGAFSVQIIEHDSVEYSGTSKEESETEDVKEFKADTLTILDTYVNNTALSELQSTRVKNMLKELYAEACSRSIHS